MKEVLFENFSYELMDVGYDDEYSMKYYTLRIFHQGKSIAVIEGPQGGGEMNIFEKKIDDEMKALLLDLRNKTLDVNGPTSSKAKDEYDRSVEADIFMVIYDLALLKQRADVKEKALLMQFSKNGLFIDEITYSDLSGQDLINEVVKSKENDESFISAVDFSGGGLGKFIA